MRSWVFDTNVVVAAHLSPHGPPGRLLGEIYARRLRLSYDTRIAVEYREVLQRPRFSFPSEMIDRFLQILGDQDLVSPIGWHLKLPDPDDAMFLEVAASSAERIIVTGNLRHFPKRVCGSVNVLSPAEAWQRHGEFT
ncbi:MAG: putative toxin-antitoxin system toxin component, PIN family [Verrucomicrobia bacterium]|nr:putative toxin-antitoxin system toxin component, PIN family [Verrucomicrobiota bacterium]